MESLHHRQPDMDIAQACKAFGVSRSGYYAHRRKPLSKRRTEDAALGREVRETFLASRGSYGSPRVMHALRRKGLFHGKARMFSIDARRPDSLVEASVERFIQSIGRPRTELFDERLSNVRVMIDGSLASVWTDYKFFRGTTFSHCGVDHFLLVKERGAWKILELSDTRRTDNCG